MKLGVILGSIRQIRRGGRVATWLMAQLDQSDQFEAELLDLNDYPLPFFDESDSPQGLAGNYSNPTAKRWSAKIAEQDAFIIITPEYNHGTSAVLKNALDWLYSEWNRKPVAFVSYSPNAVGGVRAVEQLRLNVIELHMAPIPAALHIAHVLDTLDPEGKLQQGHVNERLEHMVSDLAWWAKALKAARGQTPNL